MISFFRSARATMIVCSATATALAPATFATGIPSACAASTSMCWYPAEGCWISWHLVADFSTSASRNVFIV